MRASIPARLEGKTISFAAFLAAVQDTGALATVGEADCAARAALGELAGSLSWGAAQNLAGHLPKPLRQLVIGRSFDSSMSRFAPQVFLQRMAGEVGTSRASQDARAGLRTLDLILPEILTAQLDAELASLWGPLTLAEDGRPPPVQASRSAGAHRGLARASRPGRVGPPSAGPQGARSRGGDRQAVTVTPIELHTSRMSPPVLVATDDCRPVSREIAALSEEPLGVVEGTTVPDARLQTDLLVCFLDRFDQPLKRVAEREVLLVQVGYQLRLVPVEIHSHQHESVHLVPVDDDLFAHLLLPFVPSVAVCAGTYTGTSAG